MSARTRRDFLKQLGLAGGALAGASLLRSLAFAQTAARNVLFVSIDDLNDCPTPFGGHSGSITPNIAALAASGVVFQKAFCAGPYCGASRSSTLTGIAPYRSGLTFQENVMDPATEASVVAKLGLGSLLTIPRYFRSRGYQVWGGGKIYHGGFGEGPANVNYDENAWHEFYQTDFLEVARNVPGAKNYHDSRTWAQIQASEQARGDLPSMIGPDYSGPGEEAWMMDRQLAQWAVQKILAASTTPGAPFFLGVGFFRPHIAMYVPQRFYDLYPLDSIRVPNHRAQLDDLRDLPEYALRYLVNMDWTAYGATLADGSVSSDQYLLQNMAPMGGRVGDAQAIQAYLACVSFADDCLGQVLAALDHFGLRQSTIVVLWSDHGWFLGEKLSWKKFKMWEKAARVPLIISVPGGPTGNCSQVVSLLDLFPTLIELTGDSLPISGAQLNGKSLQPLVQNPNGAVPSFQITTQVVPDPPGLPPFHSVRTDRWRYIAYPPIPSALLSEELYDLQADPGETRNLMYWKPETYAPVASALRDILRGKIPGYV